MKNNITDEAGRVLGTQDDPAPRPAGPWSSNARIVVPRAALRGADVREALAGEVPVSPEILAEIANGRRA